jgi:hypothetical protein
LLIENRYQNSSGKDHALKRDQEDEEQLFEKLLRAMYNMPYDIYDSKELLRLTEIADYYCALRIVSCTLHAGQRFLWRQKNPPIIHKIGVREIPELFSAAVKLRNKPLFEDCLIIGAGSMIDPLYKYLEDGKVREQAKDMHIAVLRNVVETHRFLLLMVNRDVEEGEPGQGEIDEMKVAVNEAAAASITHGQLELPRYYRKLYEWKSTDGHELFGGFLQGLLWNWLTLDKTAKSGEGEFEDRFLSAEYKGDVPWDTEDTDF